MRTVACIHYGCEHSRQAVLGDPQTRFGVEEKQAQAYVSTFSGGGLVMLASIYTFGLRMIILVIFCFAIPSGFGQGTSGSLTGQVVDNSGASVAGANVVLTNAATNLALPAKTNSQGVYFIQPVPPGLYVLTVEAPGFEHYLQQGVAIGANIAATQNVTIKAGGGQETVTVTAGAELINTTSAELGTSINQRAVSQLPLNGRDPSSLVLLAPGTTNIASGSGGQPGIQTGFSFPTETGASANGGRQGSTYYLLDGVPNMDNYTLLTAPFPNSDATQEFRVITNNFNALYGFAPGAVVSIETKSGSNEFHGGAFEYLRNKVLNASGGYFSHTDSPDPLERNQFGGYIGGPILKNKLFFFANYQGTRSSSAALSNATFTPTTAMLNGDFSGISTPLCQGNTAPAGCPFKTVNGVPNQVNPALYNQAAVTVAKTALPLGQSPNGQVFYQGGPLVNNYNEGTARLDYDISPKQRLNIRSFTDSLTEPSGDVPGNILSVVTLNPYSQTFNETMEYFNEVLSHTWTINPTMVNTISAFWSQMSAHNSAAVKDINGQDVCWSRYINVTEEPGQCWIEGFDVGSGGFSSGYTEPSQEVRTTYGLYDNFSKMAGKHTFSVGLNMQHQFAEEFTLYPTSALVAFGNNGTYTGNGLADFLMGYMSNFGQGGGEIAAVSGWQPGFYGQDVYRVRPNLTVTAGLRWDPNFAPALAGGRGAAYVPGQQSTMYPLAPEGLVFPGDKGIGQGLMPSSYGYWEPRIGVAFQPAGMPHTSFRAGFGLFTSPLQYSMYNHTADISPFSPTFSLTGSIYPAQNIPLNFNDPWASVGSPTNGVSPFPPFASLSFHPPSNSVFATPLEISATFAQNFKLGVTQSWNASVEQQIGQDMVFRLAYVGSQSYHQSLIIDQNPGVGGVRQLSQYSSILTNFSNGTASYHALQATIEKHFSHGLQFQSNFTWSRGIDTASSGNISFGTNQLPNPFDLRYNRGVSALNVPLISVTNFIYTTPSLRGKNALLRQVAGEWQVGGIVTAQSGFPFGISPLNQNSGSLQNGDRADLVSGQTVQVRQGGKSHWLNQYFNTNAFMQNQVGTFGDSAKNLIQGPPIATVDGNVSKTWTLVRNYQLQFRWEMFNALNHPSFGNPGTQVGGANYGIINSLGPIPPRVGQAALRFTF